MKIFHETRIVTIDIIGTDRETNDRTMNYVAEVLNGIEGVTFIDDSVMLESTREVER